MGGAEVPTGADVTDAPTSADAAEESEDEAGYSACEEDEKGR